VQAAADNNVEEMRKIIGAGTNYRFLTQWDSKQAMSYLGEM
jgi:hypothetical protein